MTQEEMNQKEEEKEQKKQEQERNAANNAQAIRTAAKVAEKAPDPTVAAIGKAVDIADKVTGGKSSEFMGKAMNQVNKFNPTGKLTQNAINKIMESGVGTAAGALASKKIEGKDIAKNVENAKKAKDTADNAKKAKEAADNVKKTKEATENAKRISENSGKKTATSSNGDSEDKGKGGILALIGGIVGLILLSVGIVLFIPIILLMPLISIANTDNNDNILLNRVTIKNTTNNWYDGTITLEEYIAGVLAAENPPVENLQYYKFLALKTRTQYYSEKTSNNVINLRDTGKKYIPVEGTAHEATIIKAVNETRGNLIYTEIDIDKNTIKTTVTKDGDGNYNIEYQSPFMDSAKNQTISKDWEYIENYTSTLNNTFASDDEIIDILTLYLITEEDYGYDTIVNEYYKNSEIISGFSLAPTGREVNGYISPLANYTCSSGYGCRKNPFGENYGMHYGIDLAATEGENVYATKSGTIAKVVSNIPGYSTSVTSGNSIVINHDDGSQTRYYHLLFGSIPSTITVGTQVKQGDKIAEVGSTGRSTGPHLHYEIIISGKNVNPYHYMDVSFAGDDGLRCNNNSITPEALCKE